MPGMVRPVAGERETLLAYLEQQRTLARLSAFGLTDEQATTASTPSALTVGGIIKHLAAVERSWMDTVAQRVRGSRDDYENGFRFVGAESLASVLDEYAAAARATDVTVRALDLDTAVPVPKGVPWFPDDTDAWSVRWVVLHLIEETARHAGHADIVREAIDGATSISLMAAAEGWAPTEWVTPWEPAASVA